MNHLTTLDSGFLKAEDVDPRVSLAIGGLAVIEGPVPEQHDLVSVFSERIRACPRFAQRLRRYPFDLGAPQWWMTPTSTSPGTCGAWRCPTPAMMMRCTGWLPT